MDWVEEFYSRTGAWWGEAESGIGEVDQRRAAMLLELGGSGASVLELGCGYGSTARACAAVGLDVTAIDLSDRIQFAAVPASPDNPRLIRGDFYCADLGSDFDVVCYWDGFGVGEDADQRRLLRRVAHEWLAPHGTAIVEVFNPVWWATQAGFDETKEARPEEGYPCSLGHRRDFDARTCRALDSWWEIGSPDVLTQSLRCYSPADLSLLLADTGLCIDEFKWADTSEGEEPIEPSYLALLSVA